MSDSKPHLSISVLIASCSAAVRSVAPIRFVHVMQLHNTQDSVPHTCGCRDVCYTKVAR